MFASKSFGRDFSLTMEISLDLVVLLNKNATDIVDIEELINYFATISDYTIGEDKVVLDRNMQFMILFGNIPVSIEDLSGMVAFYKETEQKAKIEKINLEKSKKSIHAEKADS